MRGQSPNSARAAPACSLGARTTPRTPQTPEPSAARNSAKAGKHPQEVLLVVHATLDECEHRALRVGCDRDPPAGNRRRGDDQLSAQLGDLRSTRIDVG